MKVIFEDEHIIVCIKPIGIVSQFSENENNMISLLKEYCSCNIYPLHRLDREVGGIMVFAKNKKSAAILSRDISEQRLKKCYLALIHGIPEQKSGELRDYLFKDSKKNKSYVVSRVRKGVKEAVLEYEVLSTKQFAGNDYSVVKILLHTGRTHQIRVQFSHRKHPLVADRKYGANDNFKEIGLWSYKLKFNHPISNEWLEFSANPENIIKDFI